MQPGTPPHRVDSEVRGVFLDARGAAVSGGYGTEFTQTRIVQMGTIWAAGRSGLGSSGRDGGGQEWTAVSVKYRRAGPGRPIGQVVPFAPPGGLRTGALGRPARRRRCPARSPPRSAPAVTPVQAGEDRAPDRDRAPGRAPAVGQRGSRHLAARGEVRRIVRRRPGYPVAAR
jgi:hypothetical protein